MMNPNAKRWVEALRSRQYEQTVGALHRVNPMDDLPVGYCCLGVACDLYVKAGGKLGQETVQGLVSFTDERSTVPNTDVLPPDVQEWLGLKTEGGAFEDDDSFTSIETLASLNDAGLSFGELADTIEAEPDGLFA